MKTRQIRNDGHVEDEIVGGWKNTEKKKMEIS